jgi:hypothetical protein
MKSTDHARRGHAGDATVLADIRRDALEGHDGDGAGLFGDLGLGSVGDVHDDAALEHFSQTDLLAEQFPRFVVEPGVFHC